MRRVADDVARLTAPPSPERWERCERCERWEKALAIEALEVRRDKVGVPDSVKKTNKPTHEFTPSQTMKFAHPTKNLKKILDFHFKSYYLTLTYLYREMSQENHSNFADSKAPPSHLELFPR